MPALRQIICDTRVGYRWSTAVADYVWQKFAAHAAEVSEQAIREAEDGPQVTIDFIRCFSTAESLRHLVIVGRRSYFTPDERLLPGLAATFPLLESLHIHGPRYDTVSVLREDPRWNVVTFRHLRELRLRCSDADLFPFLRTFAPNLANLTLSSPFGTFIATNAPLVPVLLPNLRSLTLRGGRDCGHALAFLDISSLSHLDFRISSTSSGPLDCSTILPSGVDLPRGLKFSLITQYLTAHAHADVLFRSCKSCTVDLTFGLMRPLTPFLPLSPTLDEAQAQQLVARRRADAASEAIKWATDRVQWVCESGDAQGVQELAETARLIEERRVLESL